MADAGLNSYRPLAGVRILAFETAVALPSGTRLLADLGAEVVQIRRPERVGADPFVAIVDGTLLNKQSVSLNLKSEAARAIARRLVIEADVVCNNFTPRVMKSFGLSEQELRQIKPDLIVLQLSGYGSPGPWSEFPAYGPSVEAAGGMNFLVGPAGDIPNRIGSGVFADQLAGRYAAIALTGALVHRQATGLGQSIDLSMYEAIVSFLGPHIVLHQLSTPDDGRSGNRHPQRAPQGIYPAAGEDQWVAVSVETTQQWLDLVEVLDDPRLRTPGLESVEARAHDHDRIDEVISEWTRARTKDDGASELQVAGVPAGPVRWPSDIAIDDHQAARSVFIPVEHRTRLGGFSAHPHMSQVPLIERVGRVPLSDAHWNGADNATVLGSWLAMGEHEIAELEATGVLSPATPIVLADSQLKGVTLEGQQPRRDPEFAERLRLGDQ